MKKLEISQLKEHNIYLLRDLDNNEIIELMLVFYGIDKPNVGDKLLIADSLTDERSPFYSEPYSFEIDKNYTPMQVKNMNDREYIILNKDNVNIVFKRIYG